MSLSGLSLASRVDNWRANWRWRRRERRRGQVRGIWRVLQLTVAFLLLLISFVPFYWLIRTALLGSADYNSLSAVWWPRVLHWENFAAVIRVTNGLFITWWANTLFLAAAGMANVVLVNGLAAYAFAKLRFPGKELLFYVFLATMMIPGESTLVPIFLIVRALGWYDTYLGQILPGAMGAFTIFLLRQFFEGLPRELEDAARIDGCGELRVFWHIIIPLSRPILTVIAVGSIMGSIESYLWPLIVTETQEIRPIGVSLPEIASMIPQGGNPAILMAANVMMTLPVLIFLLITQRSFVKGLAGSLTG